MTTHSEKLRQQLLKKLPVTGAKGERIMLGRPFFKQLTDTEFIIMWNTPGMEIVISETTKAYIEQRRAALGLKFSKEAGFNLNEEGK